MAQGDLHCHFSSSNIEKQKSTLVDLGLLQVTVVHVDVNKKTDLTTCTIWWRLVEFVFVSVVSCRCLLALTPVMNVMGLTRY